MGASCLIQVMEYSEEVFSQARKRKTRDLKWFTTLSRSSESRNLLPVSDFELEIELRMFENDTEVVNPDY